MEKNLVSLNNFYRAGGSDAAVYHSDWLPWRRAGRRPLHYMPGALSPYSWSPIYDAQSLDTEKYARSLRAHGPYLEWQNTHEQNSRLNQVEDSDNHLADSVVHVEEFVAVVKQALKLGINSRLVQLQGPPES